MSRASEVLFASQPTISLQIKTLEEQLDTKLFERHGPKLTITTEGEILYNIVQPLVSGIDHVKESFNAQFGDLSSGQLTITAEEASILYILSKPLQDFVTQYPGIRLKVANVTGSEGYKMLKSEDADISICSLLTVPKDIEYETFVSYEPLLITPLDHPLTKLENVTLKNIGEYGLIMPSTHISSWRMVEMIFALNGAKFKVLLETGGWEVVKHYVQIGMGISIVTRLCITEEDEKKFAMIPLDKFFPVRKYGSAIRKGKPLSAPATRFLEILDQHYPQGI